MFKLNKSNYKPTNLNRWFKSILIALFKLEDLKNYYNSFYHSFFNKEKIQSVLNFIIPNGNINDVQISQINEDNMTKILNSFKSFTNKEINIKYKQHKYDTNNLPYFELFIVDFLNDLNINTLSLIYTKNKTDNSNNYFGNIFNYYFLCKDTQDKLLLSYNLEKEIKILNQLISDKKKDLDKYKTELKKLDKKINEKEQILEDDIESINYIYNKKYNLEYKIKKIENLELSNLQLQFEYKIKELNKSKLENKSNLENKLNSIITKYILSGKFSKALNNFEASIDLLNVIVVSHYNYNNNLTEYYDTLDKLKYNVYKKLIFSNKELNLILNSASFTDIDKDITTIIFNYNIKYKFQLRACLLQNTNSNIKQKTIIGILNITGANKGYFIIDDDITSFTWITNNNFTDETFTIRDKTDGFEYIYNFATGNKLLLYFKYVLTTYSKELSDNTTKQCNDLFGNFNDNKDLIEKCKKYNTVLTNKEAIEEYSDFLKKEFQYEFDNMILIHNNIDNIYNVTNYVNNSIASLFGRYLYFNENMRFNDLNNYRITNYITIIEDGKLIATKQQGRDAGGLRRDFITSLTTELFTKKIFISRDGTKKYFLNPEFQRDEEFNIIVKQYVNLDEIDVFNKFYKFIGLLLSFILVNECGIEHTLSLGIMAHFIHTTPTLDRFDYIYCLIDDFPEFSKSLFKLLESRSTIKDLEIRYNDFFSLYKLKKSYNDFFGLYKLKTSEEPDKYVDDDNIDDFIEKLATFMMTKTMLRKGIEIIKQEHETDRQFNRRYDNIVVNGQKAYSAMIEGMSMNIKTKLTTSEIPISTITSYMTAENMSKEIIENLKSNFIESMENTRNNNLKTMTNLFVQNVLTKPDDMLESDYFDFMTKLLRFWSGSTFLKKSARYKISVNLDLSPNHFPKSHTCFFEIELPIYASGEILLDKLKIALSNTEDGIGLEGGMKKRKPLKKYNKSY